MKNNKNKRKADGHLEEELRSELGPLDCKLCFLKYNSKDKEPLILSCGHTHCKTCLSNWLL